MVLIKDALERIIWHDLKIGEKKLLIIDRKGNIFHRGDIYHAKLDMPRNQMVSVPRSTPVLFKVLRLVWANVHEQPRIRLQTFFISNICWQIKKRTMKRAQCKITLPRAFPFLIWYFVKRRVFNAFTWKSVIIRNNKVLIQYLHNNFCIVKTNKKVDIQKLSTLLSLSRFT